MRRIEEVKAVSGRVLHQLKQGLETLRKAQQQIAFKTIRPASFRSVDRKISCMHLITWRTARLRIDGPAA